MVYGKTTVVTLRGNTITENRATSTGSGTIIDDGARATLQNELIVNNRCGEEGCNGLGIEGDESGLGSSALIVNSTVANHTCPGGNKSALCVQTSSSATIKNSIFWGNGGEDVFVDSKSKLQIAHSLSQKPLVGQAMLKANPLFADPQKDFHLKSRAGRWDQTANGGQGGWVKDDLASAAIDAGDPTHPVGNEAAPNGKRVNLGAYGGTPQASKSP